MHSEFYYTTQESSSQQLSFWDISQGSKKVWIPACPLGKQLSRSIASLP